MLKSGNGDYESYVPGNSLLDWIKNISL
jgi:hypothetical protein